MPLQAPVVGAPGLDALLDLLAVELLLQGLLGEFHDFVVGGKAEADQLVFSKVVDLRVPLGRGQGLQAKALFEADDAVLYFERITAQFSEGNEHGDGEDHHPLGKPAEMLERVAAHDEQVHGENGGEDKVVGGVVPGMVLETLRRGITHAYPSILSGRNRLPR